MAIIFSILAAAIGILSAYSFFLILLHAFRRSPGTGILVLCIPFYNFFYGFRQFEHRNKNWILVGWLGGLGLVLLIKLATGIPRIDLPTSLPAR